MNDSKICLKCGTTMYLEPDEDNPDGSVPYKYHFFCDECGNFELKEKS